MGNQKPILMAGYLPGSGGERAELSDSESKPIHDTCHGSHQVTEGTVGGPEEWAGVRVQAGLTTAVPLLGLLIFFRAQERQKQLNSQAAPILGPLIQPCSDVIAGPTGLSMESLRPP